MQEHVKVALNSCLVLPRAILDRQKNELVFFQCFTPEICSQWNRNPCPFIIVVIMFHHLNPLGRGGQGSQKKGGCIFREFSMFLKKQNLVL